MEVSVRDVHETLQYFMARFATEDSCYAFLEKHLWRDGRFCPHCGCFDTIPLKGAAAIRRIYHCRDCHGQFTATNNTWLHGHKLPLVKYFEIIFLDFHSSYGMSSTRIAKWVGVSQKSVWKILQAFRQSQGFWLTLGKKLAGVVEFDGKYVGGKPRKQKGVKHPRGKGTKKQPIFVAVERHGEVRATAVPAERIDVIEPIATAQVDKSAHIMSDEDLVYAAVARDFWLHSAVNHGDGEFAFGNVNNNTAESFNSWIERKRDVHFYISKDHTQRYVNDVMTRWNLRVPVEKPLTKKEKKKLSIMEQIAYIICRDEPKKVVMEQMPLMHRLGIVLSHAFGCNVRRDRKTGGIVVLAA